MKVTNNISFARIGELLRKDFKERWKTYSLYVLILLAIICIVEFILVFFNHCSIDRYYKEAPYIYIFGIIILSCVVGSLMFSDMSSKEKITRVIMTPALYSEKFIARWIIYVPLFLICFYAFVYFGDALRYMVCELFNKVNPELFDNNELKNILSTDNPFLSPLFVTSLGLLFQSIFILGSVIFRKRALQKTFAVCFCAWLLLMFSMRGIALFNEIHFVGEHISRKLTPEELKIEQYRSMYIESCIIFVITIFVWILSYFRFKESEIINRW